jgi:hypothetical protein
VGIYEAVEAYLKHKKPTNYINVEECRLLGCGVVSTLLHIPEDVMKVALMKPCEA